MRNRIVWCVITYVTTAPKTFSMSYWGLQDLDCKIIAKLNMNTLPNFLMSYIGLIRFLFAQSNTILCIGLHVIIRTDPLLLAHPPKSDFRILWHAYCLVTLDFNLTSPMDTLLIRLWCLMKCPIWCNLNYEIFDVDQLIPTHLHFSPTV